MSDINKYEINEGSLYLPASWEDGSMNILTTASSGTPGLSFAISRAKLPWGMNLRSYAEKEVAALDTSLKDYKELGRQELQLDGQPAYLTNYSWASNQGPIEQLMVMTGKAQQVLVFTATMPSSFSQEQRQQVMGLIGGFKFRA